jgi:hypothetical protein
MGSKSAGSLLTALALLMCWFSGALCDVSNPYICVNIILDIEGFWISNMKLNMCRFRTFQQAY